MHADRIAIMARGRLRALGSSLRLKQKWGAGYQVVPVALCSACLMAACMCVSSLQLQEASKLNNAAAACAHASR